MASETLLPLSQENARGYIKYIQSSEDLNSLCGCGKATSFHTSAGWMTDMELSEMKIKYILTQHDGLQGGGISGNML